LTDPPSILISIRFVAGYRTVAVIVLAVAELRGARIGLRVRIVTVGHRLIAAQIAILVLVESFVCQSVTIVIDPVAAYLVGARIESLLGIVAIAATEYARIISLPWLAFHIPVSIIIDLIGRDCTVTIIIFPVA